MSKALLIHGDCRTSSIPCKGKIDLILTDPPYNIDYKYNTYKDRMQWRDYIQWQLNLILNIWAPLLKPNGSLLYLNYPETASKIWSDSLCGTYKPVEQIAWIYHTHTGGKPLRKGTRVWLWMCVGETPYIDHTFLQGEYRNPTDSRVQKLIQSGKKPVDFDWWHYEQVKNVSKEKTKHPCQLPIEMVQRLVCAACPPKGIVFDPFLGSGTTAEACLNTDRHFIGIEQDKDYVDIAINRLSKFDDVKVRLDKSEQGE